MAHGNPEKGDLFVPAIITEDLKTQTQGTFFIPALPVWALHLGQLNFSCFGDRLKCCYPHRGTERTKELYFTCPEQSNPLSIWLMETRQERTREGVSVLKEKVNTVSIFQRGRELSGDFGLAATEDYCSLNGASYIRKFRNCV